MKKIIVIFIFANFSLFSQEAPSPFAPNVISSESIILKLYEYSNTIILKGKIELREFYGPPNYGENPKTDKKESYYFLLLDKSLIINSKNIKELQIIFATQKDAGNFMAGERYYIKGKLFLAITGHHHSPVLILADYLILAE
ncbi:MAG: hypothetical protein Ta2F_18210 [Termitinemataceae bacterium]|nr:MAG: hypothetical protein Ta2F_18210 [Termitinemataceae bacterium]